jgi:hypothetical protein
MGICELRARAQSPTTALSAADLVDLSASSSGLGDPATATSPAPNSEAQQAGDSGSPGASSSEEESLPAAPPSPLPARSTTELLGVVSDRGAAALDSTGSGFGHGLSSFGPFFSAASQAVHGGGRFAFKASVHVGEFAEKESGDSTQTQRGWEFGTRLAGTLGATLGFPKTGRFLEVQYAGSLQLGGRGQSDGKLDQALALTGHYDFAKLKLLLNADYSHATGPDRDVGQVVDRDLVALSLNSFYPLSLKSSLDLTLSDSSSQYQGGISSDELRAALFFNRQASVKTRLGVGGTVGSLEVDQGAHQTFEQLNLRVAYVPSRKITLAAMVGYEWRQIDGTTSATPVFDGSVSYAIRPTTTLSLGATRAVRNSAAQAQTNYVSSTVQVSASQKIGPKVVTSLSLGYQNATYDSVDGSESASREDNYFFARPDLRFLVTQAFSLSLFYSYGENRSTERSFQTQQVSLSGTYSF